MLNRPNPILKFLALKFLPNARYYYRWRSRESPKKNNFFLKTSLAAWGYILWFKRRVFVAFRISYTYICRNAYFYSLAEQRFTFSQRLKSVQLSKITASDRYFEVCYAKFPKKCSYGSIRVFGESDLFPKGGNEFSRIAWVSGYFKAPVLFKSDQNDIHSQDSTFSFEQPMVFLKQKPVFVKQRNSVQQIDTAIIFAMNYGIACNYFHFMTDALPSLLMSLRTGRRLAVLENAIVIIPAGLHDNIKEIILSVCAHFSVKHRFAQVGETFKISRAIVSSYPTFWANAFPRSSNFSVNPEAVSYTKFCLHHIFRKNVPLPSNGLYLTRLNSGKEGARHVVNANEIMVVLKKSGVKTVFPEKVGLRKMISLFKGAEVVYLDGGAAIANLVFLKPKSKVVLFAMSTGTDCSLFSSLCIALELDFCYVVGDRTGPRNKETWQQDYCISMANLEKAITNHVCK